MKKIFSVILVVMIFTLSACVKKEISTDKFKDFFETKEFSVTDVTSKLKDEGIKSSLVAVKNDDAYQIEYFVFKKESDAKINFQMNKNKFIEEKSGSAAIKDIDTRNHQKYAQTSLDIYSVIVRTDNTLIYIKTSADYKIEINELLEEIGY